MDRWVIPPAVVAAVAGVLAVSPPVGSARSRTGWRVEALSVRRARGDALLLRGTLDDRATEGDRAPRETVWTFLDARGATLHTRRVAAVEGVSWSYASLADARGVARVRVEGGGHRAEFAPPAPREVVAERPVTTADFAVTVLEGTLLPGVEGTAVFSSRSEVAEWRVEPAMDNAHVGSEVKTRTLAMIRMRVDGLGAPVSVVRRAFDGEERRDVARLAISSTGVAVMAPLPSFAPPDEVTLRSAFGEASAHAVWGDDQGPCGWSALRTSNEREGAQATLRFDEPARCAPSWIEATTDATFTERSGRRLATAQPHLRLYGHSDIFAAWPSPPRPSVAHDGARIAERAHEGRVRSARRVAVAALVVSVLVEVAMVLGAGVRRGPLALLEFERAPRDRAGLIASATVLIVAIGMVMGIAAMLQR